MPRIALGVEYDGSQFFGWQTQPGQLRTIQSEFEKSLTTVASIPVEITAAGRTDKGVHALGQVIHFDTAIVRPEKAWVLGTNSLLTNSLRVLWAKEVPSTFHARKSAVRRHYRYNIYNHPSRPSLLRHYVGWYYRKLDVTLMQDACQCWLGEQDFSSFRAAGCQSISPVREMYRIQVERRGQQVIVDVVANAFLHHMVRNMVGVLCMIGSGLKPVQWARTVLDARDRRQGGVTAPPYGLYLVGIEYPKSYQIPVSEPSIPGFIA